MKENEAAVCFAGLVTIMSGSWSFIPDVLDLQNHIMMYQVPVGAALVIEPGRLFFGWTDVGAPFIRTVLLKWNEMPLHAQLVGRTMAVISRIYTDLARLSDPVTDTRSVWNRILFAANLVASDLQRMCDSFTPAAMYEILNQPQPKALQTKAQEAREAMHMAKKLNKKHGYCSLRKSPMPTLFDGTGK